MSASAPPDDVPLLDVRDLAVGFETDAGLLRAVDGISFSVRRGRTLGIVGESGCGKSVTALSLLRLLPRPAGRLLGGSVRFDGLDLATAPVERLHAIRGARIGMVFQEPMTALNPVHRIGRQLAEVFLLHRTRDRAEAFRLGVEMLARVGIPAPEQRALEYPHQLSGGMRQRVVIAMALACSPDLVIADEPTTALDVTIQAQILDLLRSLRDASGTALILITHDLGVVAEMCDDVLVMYAGRVAEQGPVAEIFARPAHPYTRGLLASVPRLDTPRKTRLTTIPGQVPSLGELPAGCRFQNRCPWRVDRCAAQPPLDPVGPASHLSACWRWPEVASGTPAPAAAIASAAPAPPAAVPTPPLAT